MPVASLNGILDFSSTSLLKIAKNAKAASRAKKIKNATIKVGPHSLGTAPIFGTAADASTTRLFPW